MPGTILCTRNTNNSAQNKSLTFTETIFVVEEDISKILKQIFNILCHTFLKFRLFATDFIKG